MEQEYKRQRHISGMVISSRKYDEWRPHASGLKRMKVQRAGGEVKTCRVRSRELAEILDPSEAVGGQVNEGGGGWVENAAMVWSGSLLYMQMYSTPYWWEESLAQVKPVQFQWCHNNSTILPVTNACSRGGLIVTCTVDRFMHGSVWFSIFDWFLQNIKHIFIFQVSVFEYFCYVNMTKASTWWTQQHCLISWMWHEYKQGDYITFSFQRNL